MESNIPCPDKNIMTDIYSRMNTFMDSLKDKNPLFDDSNIKFLTMVRSALIEDENMGAELAVRITNALEVDLGHVAEDSDVIPQAAKAFAKYAGKVYDRLTQLQMHRHITDEMIKRLWCHSIINF